VSPTLSGCNPNPLGTVVGINEPRSVAGTAVTVVVDEEVDDDEELGRLAVGVVAPLEQPATTKPQRETSDSEAARARRRTTLRDTIAVSSVSRSRI
jgi:hypothetical protein